MFEGYTEKQIVEMIRAALKSPERRAELMRLLDSLGLLPQEVPDKLTLPTAKAGGFSVR